MTSVHGRRDQGPQSHGFKELTPATAETPPTSTCVTPGLSTWPR